MPRCFFIAFHNVSLTTFDGFDDLFDRKHVGTKQTQIKINQRKKSRNPGQTRIRWARSSRKFPQKSQNKIQDKSGAPTALPPKWGCCFEFWKGFLKEFAAASGPALFVFAWISGHFSLIFLKRHAVVLENILDVSFLLDLTKIFRCQKLFENFLHVKICFLKNYKNINDTNDDENLNVMQL